MSDCRACGRPMPGSELAILSGTIPYHVACAPPELIDAASEEYRAILRKGVRYFLEKYGDPVAAEGDPGAAFLALGSAIEKERGKRR